jgi:hypothetical protein
VIRIFPGRYTPAVVKATPDWIFVFGDNVTRKGLKGQAIIRGIPNSFGIPTKWRPERVPSAYFTDESDCWNCCSYDLTRLGTLLFQGANVYWPKDGIGTGLAELPTRAPNLFEYIEETKRELFDLYG